LITKYVISHDKQSQKYNPSSRHVQSYKLALLKGFSVHSFELLKAGSTGDEYLWRCT